MCLFKEGRKIYKTRKKLNFESQSCSLLIQVIKKCRETALDPLDLTSKTFFDFHDRRFGLRFCGEVLRRKIAFCPYDADHILLHASCFCIIGYGMKQQNKLFL